MTLFLPKLLFLAALLVTLLAAFFDGRRGAIPRWVSLPFLVLAPPGLNPPEVSPPPHPPSRC